MININSKNHRKHKTLTIAVISILAFIIMLSSDAYIINDANHEESSYSKNNASMINSYSWIGYDYNAKTWLDMSYLANDVGKQMAQMGNIYTDYHTDSEIEAKEGKSVIGTDDRIKVNNDSDKTAKGIAYITSVMYDDNMNTCSGTLIAENYVLTAAHCVTQATDSINKPCPSGADCVNGKYGDTSKFNKRINVYINRNNGITNDGYYSAHKVYVQQAWRIDGLIHSPYDIALIKLNEDADGHYPTDYGARVYGYGSFKGDFMGKHVSMISYPSDKWKTDKNMDGMWLS